MEKKQLIALIMGVLCFGVIIGYVFSQPSASTLTISQGVYPNSPSFTVWGESGTFYAKNAYGAIIFYGDHAEDVINNALDAGYGTVHVQRGHYDVSHTIYLGNNDTLEGEGVATVIDVDPLVSINLIMDTDDNLQTGYAVKDIMLHGNVDKGGSPNGRCIYFINGTEVYIQNCYITKFPDDAIDFHYISYGITTNNICTDNGGNGYELGLVSSYCLASNNVFSFGGHGVAYGSGVEFDGTNNNWNVVTDNQIIENNAYGICVRGGDNNIFSGNNIVNNAQMGIWLNASSNNVINSNTVRNSGEDGIYLLSSERIQITGNNLQNNRRGIVLNTALRVTISGNEVYYSSWQGICIASGSHYATITGNIVCDNGQALDNNYAGILIEESENCIINSNRSGSSLATRQKYGIQTTGTSERNTIIGNNCMYNADASSDIVYSGTLNKVAYNQGRYTPQGSA